ncbi:MAG: Flp pilus assembly protein CpaB [Candidatus Competibacter sp.]|nr:Flp pilus assembly protein CpaB [Candidatus Competibacter sp.]
MNKSNRWLLLAGVVLALAAIGLNHWYIGRIEQSQRGLILLRLKPDQGLSRGAILKPDMLDTESAPERFKPLTDVVIRDTAASREWLKDRPVNRDVAPGSLLQYDFFVDDPGQRFAALIDKGKRALAVPVTAATAVAYLVEPGSRVDLLGTFEEQDTQTLNLPAVGADGKPIPGAAPVVVSRPRATTVTKTLLQNLKVLAVGTAQTRGAYLNLSNGGYEVVTLEVTPDEAERIAFALNEARRGLTLLLRHPDDTAIQSLKPVDWNSLR